MKCPDCGAEAEQETVDVGPCEVPTGPWGCFECYWVEPEPELDLEESDD